MSPGNVRIVDRLGVLHESSTGVSLYQWTGEKVWSTELAEPDLPELKYSNDRWVVNTVLNATDLNEDGSDDLLIGFKCSSRRSELQLFAVSMLDGSLIWTSKLTVDTFGSDPAYLSARRVATLASPSNTLVISGKENYTGLSIRTGEVVWSREVRSGHEFMFLDSARIAAVTDRSHLSVLAAATGQTKHEVDVPIGWRTGGIVEIDGRQSLLGMSWDAIEVRSLVNLTVEKTLEWHKLIELSDVATSGDIYTVIAPDLDGDSQRDLFVVYFRVLPSSTDFRRLSEIRIAQRQTSDPNYTLNNERKAILSRSPRKCTLYAFSTRDFNKLYSRDLLPVISPLQSSPRVVDETYLSIADILFSFAGEAISRLPSNMHETYADADGKVDYAAISRGRNETTVRIFRGCRPPIWQTLATNAHTTEDLNGDGVLDLVGVRTIEPIVVEEQITDVRKSFSLEAISGADGQRLWEYGPLPIQFWRGTTDLDGDSCCDLLIGTCNDSDATNGLIDSVIAISGKTGRKIWRSAAFAGESPMGNIQFSLSIDVDPYRSGHRHVQVTKIEQAQEKRLIVGIRYATMSKDRTHPIQQQWLRVCLQAESGKTLWRAVAAASLVPEPGFDAAAYSDFWIHGPDSYGTQQKRSQILLDDKDCILEVDDEYGARIYDVARGETQWEGILSDEMYRKRGASSRHGTPLRRKRVALNCKLTPPNGGTEYDLVLTTNGQWFVLDGQAKTVKSGEFDDTVNRKVEKQEGKLQITVASESHSDSGQRWELSDPGGECLGIVKHVPIPLGVFCVGDVYTCRAFHMPE
jgi:outer membrane protein assembly factor BamB